LSCLTLFHSLFQTESNDTVRVAESSDAGRIDAGILSTRFPCSSTLVYRRFILFHRQTDHTNTKSRTQVEHHQHSQQTVPQKHHPGTTKGKHTPTHRQLTNLLTFFHLFHSPYLSLLLFRKARHQPENRARSRGRRQSETNTLPENARPAAHQAAQTAKPCGDSGVRRVQCGVDRCRQTCGTA